MFKTSTKRTIKKLVTGVGLSAVAALVFACSAGEGEGEDPSLETAAHDLSVERRSLWWPAVPAIDFTGILLCFEGAYGSDPQYATFRQGVTDAAKEWENATDGRLKLTPINKCGAGIKIYAETMDSAGSTKIGMNSTPIRIHTDYRYHYPGVKWLALHEIGHKLGFTHEHVHPNSTCPQRQIDTFLFWDIETDTVGLSPFPYDATSTMNYCHSATTLSPGDIENVQRLYGGNEYNLSDGRTFWLRSDHGQFYDPQVGFSPEMKGRFTFANVTKPGMDVQYGHQVTIRAGTGQYIGASSAKNSRTGVVSRSVVTYTSTPFVWDVSGFGSGTVGVNEPVAFSGIAGGERLYLVGGLNSRNGTQGLGVAARAETQPPQDRTYIWRILGPGPETTSVCTTGGPRCGRNCCGAGINCVDASIGLCCGPFDTRCGNTCCGPNQECSAGVCRTPAPTPPPPSPTCAGGAPSCSTRADCPASFDYCGAGCCKRLQ